jgi:hypothetical protein
MYCHKYLPATTEGYPNIIEVSGGTYFHQYLLSIPVGFYIINNKLKISGILGCGFSKPIYKCNAIRIDPITGIRYEGILGCFYDGIMFTYLCEIESRFWLNKHIGLLFNMGYSHLKDMFTIPYFNLGVSLKAFNNSFSS